MQYYAEDHSHGATVAQNQFCYSYNEHNEVKREVKLTSTAISEQKGIRKEIKNGSKVLEHVNLVLTKESNLFKVIRKLPETLIEQ